jgi:hypothetical protein
MRDMHHAPLLWSSRLHINTFLHSPSLCLACVGSLKFSSLSHSVLVFVFSAMLLYRNIFFPLFFTVALDKFYDSQLCASRLKSLKLEPDFAIG